MLLEGVPNFMTWSPYSYYDSRDPGSLKQYGDKDPGPQFHINIGTRGPWNGGGGILT